jgi:hypothetical protein
MGIEDEQVSPVSVQRFQAVCEDAGVECQVFWFRNASHNFTSANGEAVAPKYSAVKALISAFAVSCVRAED